MTAPTRWRRVGQTGAALAALLLASATRAPAQHPHAPEAAATDSAAAHRGHSLAPLGIGPGRNGSGTSWLPDASPMHALHAATAGWELMLHGNLFLQYIEEGSDRGDAQLGSINWLMGMASRPFAGGQLSLRGMLSAEPWTVGECGYPDLLATGEFCNGEPIHDRQHPHDLLMELAASYQREVGRGLALELYGGPAAEPALGPTAYPHRVSAYPGPLAPITHHWLDATHITFGSATAGLYGRTWKLEGSLFNGREPDENRFDLDLAPLDSYSGRVTFLPGPRWALQLSAARLTEAEPGHEPDDPRVDVQRYTASAVHHQPLAGGGYWASTAALGRNEEEGSGTHALLLESSLSLRERHIVSAHLEWVQKAGHDLALEDHELEDEVFAVAKAGAGYTLQLGPVGGWQPGIGAAMSISFLPRELEPFYGQRRPLGLVVFGSLRPRAMEMEMEMGPARALPAGAMPAHPGH